MNSKDNFPICERSVRERDERVVVVPKTLDGDAHSQEEESKHKPLHIPVSRGDVKKSGA